jgi:hypothetical protein
MAIVPARFVRGAVGRARLRAGLPALLALLAGCVTTGVDETASGSKPPPPAEPCQIVTTWENTVRSSPDPTRGGAPQPVLAARLYLFSREANFIAGDGEVKVVLFDETHGPAKVALEAWNIDPVSLKTWLGRDRYGWGYTLVLPFTQYRPDICKVRLRTCYIPAKGAPQYSESLVTLAGDNGVVTERVTTTSANKPKS